jgi:hypothetical protein
MIKIRPAPARAEEIISAADGDPGIAATMPTG